MEGVLLSVLLMVDPKEIAANRDTPVGPGTIAPRDLDAFMILLPDHQKTEYHMFTSRESEILAAIYDMGVLYDVSFDRSLQVL